MSWEKSTPTATGGHAPSPAHSDHYEDARSEPAHHLPSPTSTLTTLLTSSVTSTTTTHDESSSSRDKKARRPRATCPDEEDFFELLPPPPPPLETLFPLSERNSLLGSLEEHECLPSTPLTEEQLRQVEANGREALALDGVTINRVETLGVGGNGPSGVGGVAGEDGDDGYYYYDLRGMMHNAAEQAEEFAIAIWHKLQSWKVIHFSSLPQWLQDNDFLHFGHRPPLPTLECFKSITRIHTETGNIWTHLLGVVAFMGLALFFVTRPLTEIQLEEKLVFSIFFAGAIICLGLSFLYHTLCCHNNKDIGKLFAKFDYCGITFLTIGSFIPWLYYSFYCDWRPQVIYLSIVVSLGLGAVVVSTFDFFAGPKFRTLRAVVFIVFGLSGIAPATHYCLLNGFSRALDEAALGWLILMGALYITGALVYAMRIPERFFPGKVDIWFHSHQIFHCFVIAGAFVHYHGMTLMALYRLKAGECPIEPVNKDCLVKTITLSEA